MTTIDRIRREIERRKNKAETMRERGAYLELLDFLDTLEEPEQPTRGYDEAYLNEKIAKASKSWEGVDVDKFMDEVRGREPVSDCHDLGEAAEKYAEKNTEEEYHTDEGIIQTYGIAYDAFKAGAEWQKAKIMKGAVDYKIVNNLAAYPVIYYEVNHLGLKYNDKVKIIIVKEEEQ